MENYDVEIPSYEGNMADFLENRFWVADYLTKAACQSILNAHFPWIAYTQGLLFLMSGDIMEFKYRSYGLDMRTTVFFSETPSIKINNFSPRLVKDLTRGYLQEFLGERKKLVATRVSVLKNVDKIGEFPVESKTVAIVVRMRINKKNWKAIRDINFQDNMNLFD